MSGECDYCGNHALECECLTGESSFLICKRKKGKDMDKEIRKIEKNTKHVEKELKRLEKSDKKRDNLVELGKKAKKK